MTETARISILTDSSTGPTSTSPTSACHVMAKPSGSVCNIDCQYCFYLEKEKLYPDAKSAWRMSDEVLELYVQQYIEAQDVPAVNFAWQGGEPTLMGVDFYRRAVELQKQYANGKQITNAFQTNGILLDDEWGEFLVDNDFLVGLSIDGPRELHDRYRVDKGQKPTFDRVIDGLEVLQKHKVEFNTLTVLQNHNAEHPLEVYHFLKEIGSGYMQFIPIVERLAGDEPADGLELVLPEYEGKAKVTRWSVSPTQYGRFLCTVFDEWVRLDVGRFFVQIFDVSLGSWLGQDASLCIFAETCGSALIIEKNGDLYSCDHFVYPDPRHGGQPPAAQVRPGQGRHAAALLPRVRLQIRLQRRLPETPLRVHTPRRGGTELPVQGVQDVLRPHRPLHGCDGQPSAPAAAGHGGDGLGPTARRGAGGQIGCRARPQRSVSVRQRSQVQALLRERRDGGEGDMKERTGS